MRINRFGLGLAVLVLGCGGSEGETGPDLTVAAVSVAPVAPDTLFSLGDTVKLTASASDRGGAAIPSANIAFSSSATGVATVSDQGIVVAVGNGEATITAGSGGVSSSVKVRVRQRLASVALSPASGTITPGHTITVVATGRDARGSPIVGLPLPTFGSSDEGVASVSSMGIVTGQKLGQVTVTGTIASGADGTRSGTSSITVAATPPSAATVTMGATSFNAATIEIGVGGTVTWTNPSGTAHDVDFGTGAAQHILPFDSGSRSLTFASAGTFMYFCNLHAGMTGTIVVR